MSKFRGISRGPKARLTRGGQNLKSKRECKCRNRTLRTREVKKREKGYWDITIKLITLHKRGSRIGN